MPRADLLLQLVESGSKGDKPLFRKTVEAIVSEERAKNHKILADKLEEGLRSNDFSDKKPQSFTLNGNGNRNENRIDNLLYEYEPSTTFSDLVLNLHVKSTLAAVIEEQHRSDILRSYGMEPRHRILLIGPPGNGKTSLAEAIAHEAALPFFSIKYEGLIGSYLGETASKLKSLFDFIRTQRCVVFFDEFDTIGKERGDVHETGEIKRVVSSLLLQIDKLPSYAIVIAATNHPELLDRAVWRRFQVKVAISSPSEGDILEFLNQFENKHKISLGIPLVTISKQFGETNYSEIKDFCNDVYRRYVLSSPMPNNLKSLTKSCLEQRIESFKLKL